MYSHILSLLNVCNFSILLLKKYIFNEIELIKNKKNIHDIYLI